MAVPPLHRNQETAIRKLKTSAEPDQENFSVQPTFQIQYFEEIIGK